jgi:ATP-dependent 26S proteasome regulatory subunit
MDPTSVPLLHVDIQPLEQVSDANGAGKDSQAVVPSFLAANLQLHLLRAKSWHAIWDSDAGVDLNVDVVPANKGNERVVRQGYLSPPASRQEPGQSPAHVISLPQQNLLLPPEWPCQCRVYAMTTTGVPGTSLCHTTASTTLHVLPLAHREAAFQPDDLTGEWEETGSAYALHPQMPEQQQQHILGNHNPETVRELSLRMQRMWSQTMYVGSTAQALSQWQRQSQRRRHWRRSRRGATAPENNNDSMLGKDFTNNMEEAVLLVHSQDHGAGKTLLVKTLGRHLEPQAALHVVRVGALLATYGTAADAALASNVHRIAYRAALQQRPVCILLDGLEVLMLRATPGDAAMPVVHALQAYLRVLTRSLQEATTIPFPHQNPFYHFTSSTAQTTATGHVWPVRLCLVGVLTCPDAGGPVSGDPSTSKPAWDIMVVGTYRLPALTASTRLAAFQAALQREGLVWDTPVEEALPRLAASAIWARGSAFDRLAQYVGQDKEGCTVRALHRALVTVGRLGSSSPSSVTKTKVSFEAAANPNSSQKDALFGSVGGNTEAKMALREALALDPKRRKLLASFGLSPPTGVLLFGPPGTGKTLLAKAVAKILQRSDSPLGGAFISLSSSDLVNAEVGTGEKLLVSAFAAARMNAPAVIFLDEFQALFTDRSSGGSSRFSSTLLSLLDDVRRWEQADQHVGEESEVGKRMVVLAATNTPWMVDKAFLRPGRFDQVVHVGLPDHSDRQHIFALLIRQMRTRFGPTAQPELCRRLADATEGYSGADIAVVCRTAAVDCLMDETDAVDGSHFLSALVQVKASSSFELVSKIELWRS